MNVERKLEQLVERVKKAHRERLVSVVLYGSAATGEHHEKFSDLNVLCVLTNVTAHELRESEGVFRWWREMGNPAPLLLSEEEVRTSTDCFPIEFHDIKARHRILFGRDVVADLKIDDSFYRAQVEHELRAKLLRLRQKGAGVLFDKALLLQLMADSVSTFFVLSRHALVLAGAGACYSQREILAELGGRFGMETAALAALLDYREGKVKAGALDAGSLFAQYLRGVEELVSAVDGLAR